jgi:hypothetical protein
VRNVRGVPWDDYAVHLPAWEHTREPISRIDFKQMRRLKLANASFEPRAVWFWTVEHGVEEAGTQFHLKYTYGEDVEAVLRFEIEVTNTTVGNPQLLHGLVTIPPAAGGGIPTFLLSDVPH